MYVVNLVEMREWNQEDWAERYRAELELLWFNLDARYDDQWGAETRAYIANLEEYARLRWPRTGDKLIERVTEDVNVMWRKAHGIPEGGED